jgi:parvulin-like peptidyl-prolyl isomerase
VQAAVFNAGSGDIVGPVKTDMGYHIIRVDELKLGELDEDTREQIREAIYAEWIASEHERARTEVLLYEAI